MIEHDCPRRMTALCWRVLLELHRARALAAKARATGSRCLMAGVALVQGARVLAALEALAEGWP